jgi:hypothetical protein
MKLFKFTIWTLNNIMKKITLALVVLMSSLSFSQNNSNNNSSKKETIFKYNSEGLNPNEISIEMEGFEKRDLYLSTMNWIKEKYKNPDQVITNEQKDKKITLEGFTDNAICFGLGPDYSCEGLSYIIEIKFEDEEYNMKVKKLSYINKSNKKENISLEKSDFHSGNNDLSKNYTKVPSQIETLFNNLNTSLYNFINKLEQVSEW